MDSQQAESAVIIIGGGIGGLTLAAYLQKLNLACEVFETAKTPDPIGGGLKLWPNALKSFANLGVVQQLKAKGSVIKTGFVKKNDGSILSRIPLGNLEHSTGYPTLSLTRANILEILRQNISKDIIHNGKKFQLFEDTSDGVKVIFEDRSIHHGKILVGVDGVQSAVRGQLFFDRKLEYAGRISWRGLVSKNRLGAICPETESWEILGKGSRFGYAHMGAEQIGWYAPINNLEDFYPVDTKKYLLDYFKSWPRPVCELIENTQVETIVRSPIRYRGFDEDWGRDHATLLGDAAHAMTPDLAQGACQAIEDAIALGNALKALGLTPQALRAYEKGRIERVRYVANRSMRIGKISNHEGALVSWLMEKMWKILPGSIALKGIEKVVRLDSSN